MRILITGGSGFIGTNLIEYLENFGHQICNFDISIPRNHKQLSYWVKGDLLDLDSLKITLLNYKPELIYHLAARTDLEGTSLQDYSVNTVGVENLITAAKKITSIKNVIFASSRLVCKIGYLPLSYTDYCPSTFYGESKVVGELIVRKLMSDVNFSSTIIRPTSIWGPWFSVPYKDFFISVARGRYYHPGSIQILKSFGYVGNSVFQLDKIANAPISVINGSTFYLADYKPIDVFEMAVKIQKEVGAPQIKSIPLYILRLAAKMGDILKIAGLKNPPLTSFRLNNLLTPMTYNLEDLFGVAGHTPYSLEMGIEKTLKWLDDQDILS